MLGSALVNRKDLKSNILQARTKVKDFVRKLFKGGGKKKALSRLNDSDTVKPATEPNLDPTDVGSGSAAKTTPSFKTWNQFQAGTKGQFASRADAGHAWQAYKQANGITTGAVRSQAQKSLFLREAADSGNYPKWMNQWLQQGKVPPGYHIDHIKPLSIGGDDLPSNMRLLDIDMHKVHHQFYRPWE